MKNKKGFTLVELLAVIVILSVIIVIAVPKIMGTVTNSKKASLETATLSIISGAEKLYLENQLLGIKQDIKCSDVAKMQANVYGKCKITFDEAGNATVILNGKKDGKFDNLACSGTKEGVTCIEGTIGGPLNCTYNGQLTSGAEFVHNQYTYTYKKEYVADLEGNSGWQDLSTDGWHVRLTDLSSIDPVNTPICSYINDKPVVSTSLMFAKFNSNGNPIASQTTEIDVSSWDTDNVTNMMGMFAGTSVTEIKGISNLETDNVTNMSFMFALSNLDTIDLTGMNFENVESIDGMFFASNSKLINLSNAKFKKLKTAMALFGEPGYDINMLSNIDIVNMSGVDFSALESGTAMFASLRGDTLNLSNANFSGLTSMEQFFLFVHVKTFDLSNVDASNVENVRGMFGMCGYLTGENIESNGNYKKIMNINVTNMNLSKVTKTSGMFTAAYINNIDLTGIKMPNLTDMSLMFDDTSINSVKASDLDTSKVTSMGSMFNMSGINDIDVSNWNVSSITSTGSMFRGLSVETLDLSKWNTSNMTNMSGMFSACYSKNLVLSNFDTSNVTNMSYMFSSSAATVLDLSSFDTSKVTDMTDMFNYAKATVGYARTQADADKFNASSNKPAGLTFIVKP